MVNATTNDTPTDGGDIPPVDPTTTAYICFYTYPGRTGRYGAINAVDIDQAWDIAWASVAGTQWVPTRIFEQPVWTGNATAPDGHGTVAEL